MNLYLSFLKSQLDALEESKTMLTSEVVLLRKQLTESLELNSSLRSEKDMLESRASDFAVERAELRATLDTLQAEKVRSCESDIVISLLFKLCLEVQPVISVL